MGVCSRLHERSAEVEDDEFDDTPPAPGDGLAPNYRQFARRGDRMPFGKYKGVPLSSVPSDYLRWFLENIVDFSDIKAVMKDVLDVRQSGGKRPGPPVVAPSGGGRRRRSKMGPRDTPESVARRAKDLKKLQARFPAYRPFEPGPVEPAPIGALAPWEE